MPAPYRGDEVATAIAEELRRAGRVTASIRVVADDANRQWRILMRVTGGGDRSHVLPYATARGIYTPREIARLVTGSDWPFS
jgi:hypothetical protein